MRAHVDALLRALCPSVDATLLSAASRVRVPRGQDGVGSPRRHCARRVRPVHTSTSTRGQPPQPTQIEQFVALEGLQPGNPGAARSRDADAVVSRDPSAAWASQQQQPPRAPAGDTQPRPNPHRLIEAKRRKLKAGTVPREVPLPPLPPGLGFPGEASKSGIEPGLGLDSETRETPGPEPEPNVAALKPSDRTPLTAPELCELSDVPASRLDSTPTPVIYQALHLLPSRQGQGGRIRHLVRYLVEQRGEPPSVSLYEALVVANFDTATGSASELRDMLLEMKKAGVQPSRSFYHRALQLLAIHPDYLSRNTILRDLKDRGMELNDSGKCSVALGLLRDGQNEMALDYWDELCRDKTDIPDWVFEIFVYVLTARGFVDEALQVFRQRLDKAPVPLRTWFYLLEECSRSLHYEGTTFIWEKMVQPGTLHPADGICLNVLNTASRHGDPALATAVIQLLSDRGVKLGLHHYEPLLESYVHVGDLENAFRVLCIMAGAGVQPDQSSTRSIYAMLKGSPERVKGAVSILEKLHKEHELPAVALNVLLEVLAETGDMARTLDTYRQVCDLCRSGPNQQTFDILLGQDCRSADAVFLISEMDRFSIRPSAPILDSLIYSFALDGNLDVAMLYLTEMNRLAGSSSWLSRRTFLTVLLRCYKENDPRLPMLLEEAKRRWADIEEEFASRVTEIRRRE